MYIVAPDGNDNGLGIFYTQDDYWLFSSSLCENNQFPCEGIVNTDELGEINWRQIYQWDPPINFQFKDIEKTPSGNFLVCGVSETEVLFDLRPFITKMTPTGDTLWHKNLEEGLLKDSATEIEPDGTDNYWLYTVGGILGEYSEVILVKIDTSGNIIWETAVDDLYQFVVNTGNLEALPNNDLVLSYIVRADINDFQAVAACTDSMGVVTWMKDFDVTRLSGCAAEVQPHPAGGSVLGWCRDTSSFNGADNNPVVYRLDETGNIVWEYYFFKQFIRQMTDLAVSPSGDIFVCGAIYTDYAWLAKLNAAGELLWERQFRLPEYEYWGLRFNEMVATPDGGVAMVGARPVPFDTIQGVPIPKYNMWLVKTDADGCLQPGCQDSIVYLTATQEPGGPAVARAVFFRVSPNPTTGPVQIEFFQPISAAASRLRLFDLRGKELAQRSLSRGATESAIDLSTHPPGVYVLTLELGGRVVQTEQVVRGGG